MEASGVVSHTVQGISLHPAGIHHTDNRKISISLLGGCEQAHLVIVVEPPVGFGKVPQRVDDFRRVDIIYSSCALKIIFNGGRDTHRRERTLRQYMPSPQGATCAWATPTIARIARIAKVIFRKAF